MSKTRKFRLSLPARLTLLAVSVNLLLLSSGCTTLRQWWHNGLKVGPNYKEPPAPMPAAWTAAADPRIHCDPEDQCRWWSVFNDPVLDSLIDTAYHNNLDLQKAAAHIIEARSQWCMDLGNLLPQSQSQTLNYLHLQISKNLIQSGLNTIFNLWAVGPYISWEMDIWGKLRRTAESDRAAFDGSIANYHDVLVILLSDVATNYIQLRAAQQRLIYLYKDLELQDATVRIVEDRFQKGFVTELDVQQAKANRAQTAAQIPPIRTNWQQANNRLCLLLGEPVHDLEPCLEYRPIPTAPSELAVGIPADLLRRRPDVRRAEREVATQSAKIGVAEADYYPSLSLIGFMGDVSSSFNQLFTEKSFTAFIVPGVSWKILNYGRIANNVKLQDATLKQKALAYQQAVLKAGEEVDSAIVAFLNSQEQLHYTQDSVQADERSVELSLLQYKEGTIAFDRALNAEVTLAQQRDHLATSQQDNALDLVHIYKALGGGWQCFQCPEVAAAAPELLEAVVPRSAGATESLPSPAPAISPGEAKKP